MSQFGLVAEDVEKVNPDLVVRDKEGKPYSVRDDQVNAMIPMSSSGTRESRRTTSNHRGAKIHGRTAAEGF